MSRSHLLVAALCLLVAMPVLAQEEPSANAWELSLESNLSVNQTTYSDNWDGSEQGAYTWTSLVNGRAQKQLDEIYNSRTTLRLEFGQTHTQNPVTKDYLAPTVSADRIDLESILRADYGLALDPFVAGRFQSQFLDSRDPAEDFYINPMRFTESIGISKPLLKTENRELLTRLGFALHENLDRNALLDATTNEYGSDWTYDGGLELVADFKTPLLQDQVTYTGRLSLYQALFYSESDKLEGTPSETDWQALDVEFESTFTAAIAGHLNVSLDLRLLYDRQISKGGRLKQALALGLGYTFI
ncbi:hypothetical protein KQI63_07055 [bacterium]|nr:hypothetical protein [bacterium]